MSPRTVVFNPFMVQSTYLLSRNMKRNLVMVIMINREGRLTAMVQIAEPQMLPGCRVADVGGGVEGDGSRGALGNGDDVRKVGNTDPLVGFHHVVLYQG